MQLIQSPGRKNTPCLCSNILQHSLSSKLDKIHLVITNLVFLYMFCQPRIKKKNKKKSLASNMGIVWSRMPSDVSAKTVICVYLNPLPERCIWFATWQTSSPSAHSMNGDGHSEVWLRGCRPVTGRQVSWGRLGGVRPSRMMSWLIQQHLWSGGGDFSHSHRGITEVTEYSAQTCKVHITGW